MIRNRQAGNTTRISGHRVQWVSGILAVFLAAACWAASGIFAKLIMSSGSVSSLHLAFLRDAAAFAVFSTLVLIFEHNRIAIRREDWLKMLGMGASLGIFHVVLNSGYRINGAAITTIQQSVMPAIVLVAARIIWKEPLTRWKLFSLAVVAAGTVLVSGLYRADAPDISAGGILLSFLVPLLYAAWSLFGKALRSGGYSVLVTLFWAFGIAASILLIPVLLSGDLLIPRLPPAGWIWFAGLIGLSTIGGFFIFTFALGRLPAGIATILVMSEIAFASLYARFFLDEILAPLEIAGTLVIITGVIFLLVPESNVIRKKNPPIP